MVDDTLIYAIGALCMLSVGAATVLTIFTLDEEDPQRAQGPVKKGIKRTLFLILLGILAVALVVYASVQTLGGFIPAA